MRPEFPFCAGAADGSTMADKRDYYQVLGLGRNASDEEIKRAYRRLAREYHPDVNKDPAANDHIKEINEAYEVLKDESKRALYDRYGHAGVEGQVGHGFADTGFNDIFESFFNAFGGRQTRQGPQQGAHLKTTIAITLEEAVMGCEKEVTIPRLEQCPECHGSGAEPGTTPMRCPQCRGAGEVRRVSQSVFGQFVNVMPCPRCEGAGEVINTPCHFCQGQRQVQMTRTLVVKIPAGVDDGMQIRLADEGETGIRGGPPGHLYVQVAVKPHKLFKRQDHDLVLEMPVNIAQAALGDEVSVPTLDGPEKLKVPAGTQPGQVLRLRNHGVPYLKRTGRGDLLVVIKVVVPTNLNDKQKGLLRDFLHSVGPETLDEDKSVIDKIKDVFR